MRWKLAFGLASDDLFFVTMRRDRVEADGHPVQSKVTIFADEDEFLANLMQADLCEEHTTRLAIAVLLSVAKPTSPPAWTEIDLTQREMEMLHLVGPLAEAAETDPFGAKDFYLKAARSGSLPQFYDLLMQAPTALSMVMGPEHRYSFLNDRYARLVGIKSIARALGTSLLDKYDHGKRPGLSDILDRVYRTGEPYMGIETPRTFFHEESGTFKELYFDTVCQPITNAFGEVAGIMVQTTDVTEKVLARAVQEDREKLLYRQWAELEAIYRSAPVAMMLIDAKDFRILRLNEKQAELLGHTVAGLLGRPLLEVVLEPAELRGMLAEVLSGAPAREHIVEVAQPLAPSVHRYWLKNCAPILSASGKVESIILAGLEISEATRVEIETVASKDLELVV